VLRTREDVFCYHFDHLGNAIRYVEDNPLRERKRRQNWLFVTPFTR